ncbi:Protein SET DOMAIN GROUP 41-like protein [Melia azedarach]|uniref:Protein SET DOMAIN GROUP 41-like protein n=1 Tax=Melia azedarach TaxID=155640 RepID=A0ACC1WPS1_MELAZ|nr:Protein SET DOMAIN GROUP 41-like protein [Melia azedarach]
MEMEMRANEEIKQGEDLTPPLFPLTFSLHDSFLDSHCSSCFSPLPSSPLHPTTSVLFCSPHCSSLPYSPSELRLLLSAAHTSDLRAALRLLSLLQSPLPVLPSPRLFGLLTNRDKLTSSPDSDVASKIREGADEMARARGNLSKNVVWEEAALCLVITNAVEVQDKSGRILGIAVYDKDFSWINHSCSPNACYRFLVSDTNTASFCGETKMRIAPHPHVSNAVESTQEENDVCSDSKFAQGSDRYGPRIIVRSIKPIKKHQDVTVAYTDLLQPKAMRRAELWSKYQFFCRCERCAASPPTYVDLTLEEISVSNLGSTSLTSDHNFPKDDANQKLNDYMDEVISEYLSVGDPKSCCKKLENMLIQGLQGELLETKQGKLQLNFRLYPLHHLALNAYTTLASAYKIRSIDLLAVYSEIGGAFDMSRTSAAYSLLLAGATGHLFQSESSVIASAANFWASAGECLLTLARSSAWNLFVKPASPVSISSLEKHKCSNCSLVDRFQVNSFLSQSQNTDFQTMSTEILDCITDTTQKVWSLLVYGCRYLQIIKDPIDFSWLGKSSNAWNFQVHFGSSDEDSYYQTEDQESTCRNIAQLYNNEGRLNIYWLGVHCLLYGSYLANICYGLNSHLTCDIKNVLYNEEK